MNKTALKLKRWMAERNPSKDDEYISWRCRSIWEKYGEGIIKKAMNQKSCTSPAEMIKLCNYYLKEQNN